MKVQKAEQRTALSARCRATAAESGKIQQRLLAQDWWPALWQVGVYREMPGEVALSAVREDLWRRKVGMAVPAWSEGAGHYVWADAGNPDGWKPGRFGILEPAVIRPFPAARLRGILVPGLAFDRRGGRLGRGGGFFDRLLHRTHALLIGLCVERALVASLPMEKHDVPMDIVITEKKMIFLPSAVGKFEQLIG